MRTAPAANLWLPVRRGRRRAKQSMAGCWPRPRWTLEWKEIFFPPLCSPHSSAPIRAAYTVLTAKAADVGRSLGSSCYSMEQTCQSVPCISTQHHLKPSSTWPGPAVVATVQAWTRGASRLALGAPPFLSSTPANERDLFLVPQSQHSGMCLL